MRIGKILIDSDHDTHEAKVVYAKFPEDISQRKVLLMYPIMSKHSIIYWLGILNFDWIFVLIFLKVLAIQWWRQSAFWKIIRSWRRISCWQIYFALHLPLRLSWRHFHRFYLSSNWDWSLKMILISMNFQMKILTSEIHPVAPNHFGQKYFGTDWMNLVSYILEQKKILLFSLTFQFIHGHENNTVATISKISSSMECNLVILILVDGSNVPALVSLFGYDFTRFF